MTKHLLLVIVLLTSFALPVFPPQPSSSQTKSTEDVAPQQPQQSDANIVEDTDVVRITTNLVQIDAVVTKNGKQVRNKSPKSLRPSGSILK